MVDPIIFGTDMKSFEELLLYCYVAIMLNVFSIGSQWLKQKSCSHCFMYVHTVTGSGYQ